MHITYETLMTLLCQKIKKNFFLKSYIPSSVKTWNESSIDIKRATSLNSLKSKLSDLYGSSTYHLFLAEDGNGAVNHSRMRMGLSALNAQRKRYKFIESSRCDHCCHKCENTQHYLLLCPAFAALRQAMVGEMDRCIPQVVQPYLNNAIKPLEFSKLLLYGTKEKQIDSVLFGIALLLSCIILFIFI